jgi:hypothetical protein
MFGIENALLAWKSSHLSALAVALAAALHPGAEKRAATFLEAAAEAVDADPAPVGGPERELGILLTFANGESNFGAALSGRRWDSHAYGILQIRGPASLEHDEVASVREWLRRLHAAAKACGDARATAGLSSGRCDRGTRLAARREREASEALARVRSLDSAAADASQ